MPIGSCEVVTCSHGIGVVVTQDTDTFSEDLFEQSYGFAKASRGHVRACDGIGTMHVLKIGGDCTQRGLGIVKAPR